VAVDIDHCEYIVGGKSKRQQWPSTFTIVNRLLAEMANVNNGDRYSPLRHVQ